MNYRTVFKWVGGLLLILPLIALLPSCVPSKPSEEGKSCLDCHSEYRQLFSAGEVHKPVKAGDCFGCHRKHGLVGGAYLKQEGAKLCFSCHQTLARELAEKPLHHEPVSKGQCSLCHQPHNSANRMLLLKPEEQLCFNCHDAAGFKQAYVHPPLAQGCQTCHEPHGSKVPKLLVKDEVSLCRDCHVVVGKEFVTAHNGYPVENGCTDCHSVHSSGDSRLLKKYIHQPVAARECARCHAAAQAADSFAVKDRSAELCYSCHDRLRADFSASGAHAPVADGDCFACHSPHASDFKGIAKTDPQGLCFNCHSFEFFGPRKRSETTGFMHAPAGKGECLACHGPHLAAKGQAHLLRKDAAQLCVECHAEKIKRQTVNHQPALEANCLGCHLPHESSLAGVLVKPQRVLCAECHQQVGEDLGLQSLHRPFVAGSCSSCHEPHGAELPQLLRARGADGCGTCHGTIETERKVARHQPFKKGRCELCHRSHGSEQPFLLERPIQEVCVDCHQDRRSPEGTPGGHQNCSVCHYSHGNAEVAFLLKPQPELCLGCHDVDQYWQKGVAHAPAAEGQCNACHDPHAPQQGKVGKKVSALCGECHDVDMKTLQAVHKNIAPSEESCLSCHDPHGGPDASLTLPIKHKPFANGDCRSCHKGGSE